MINIETRGIPVEEGLVFNFTDGTVAAKCANYPLAGKWSEFAGLEIIDFVPLIEGRTVAIVERILVANIIFKQSEMVNVQRWVAWPSKSGEIVLLWKGITDCSFRTSTLTKFVSDQLCVFEMTEIFTLSQRVDLIECRDEVALAEHFSEIELFGEGFN